MPFSGIPVATVFQNTMGNSLKNSLPEVAFTVVEERPIPEVFRHWQTAQETLAASNNLALVTISSDNDYQHNVANETSICRSFLSNPEKASMCAEYCGHAYSRVLNEDEPITFRCGANLHCFAAKVSAPGEPVPKVLLGGRVFLSASDYRQFLQSENNGSARPDPELFSNIKFTDQEEFDRMRQMVVGTASEIFAAAQQQEAILQDSKPSPAESSAPIVSAQHLESFFNNAFEQNCREAMQMIGACFHLNSAALLMKDGGKWLACAAGGASRDRLIGFSLNPDSSLLEQLQAAETGAFKLALDKEELTEVRSYIHCFCADAFPFFMGNELTGILLALDTEFTETTIRQLSQLGKSLIVPLELSRLREEVYERNKSMAQWQEFAHLLATRTNSAEAYSAIVEKVSANLNAERVSLLIYQEESKQLLCQAAVGLSEEVINDLKMGSGISEVVLERGEPLLVSDVTDLPWLSTRLHHQAQSDSFISFPILSGSKRFGVLNITDRTNGYSFNASDLNWLRMLSPYVIAALEKIELKEKAQRFQLMAITDPLTGLLNRRYLEERFNQEIERSKRYQFPLSFVMMDIDSFKSFNDTYGHQAGDDILRETADCIRKSLRNFDVPARYGGEEFIVVLPETDVTSATVLAERLRRAVESHFAENLTQRPVTISVGVSSLSKTLQNRQQVIRAADQALYAAKKRGKNCVVVYNTELVPGLA